MGAVERPRPDLEQVRLRIQQKRLDYIRYDFNRNQNDLLRTFFDLAQEFESIQDLARVCVALPLEFMGLESNLHLLDKRGEHCNLFCASLTGLVVGEQKSPPHIRLADRDYEAGDALILPIRRPHSGIQEAPVPPLKETVIGMFEIFPRAAIAPEDRFFFGKYVNRIGFNLHNRMMAQQNVLHLKFINNLVRDIEHNVLIPNIYFRHLFNRLRKKITELEKLEQTVARFKQFGTVSGADCELVMGNIQDLHMDLEVLYKDLRNHHANYSLSLESLLRRDHFLKGHFVLHPKSCYVEKEIIAPQLDYHRHRFEAGKIEILRPLDMLDEEFPLFVDVGLLAQVYDNLFSNAVKYAAEITDYQGKVKKVMAYGREILPDYFGPGQDGVKFNVYTTGPHLALTEMEGIFSDGVRGKGSAALPGTGHGLAFVKQVIEIHGGRVGCETTPEGNNFYFILPLSSPHHPGR